MRDLPFVRRAIQALEGDLGDVLVVLGFIAVYGWIGAIQDPRDEVELWVGQVCWLAVTCCTVYAGWRAILAGRTRAR